MRSVLVALRNATEQQVAGFLDQAYPGRRATGGACSEPRWTAMCHGDSVLSIGFYRDGPSEFEPDQWDQLVVALGGAPGACLIADVSGRHAGNEQVDAFVKLVLERFDGLAQDDDWEHFWSLAELTGGDRVQGHPFFDTIGWYEERNRKQELGTTPPGLVT